MEIFSNKKKGKKKQTISLIWGYSWYKNLFNQKLNNLIYGEYSKYEGINYKK